MSPSAQTIPTKTWLLILGAALASGGGSAAALSPRDTAEDIATLKAQQEAVSDRLGRIDANLDRIESKLDRLIERGK